jgi:hypothetical protein
VTNTRTPSESLLALYREAETLSEQIRQWHGRRDSAGRDRLIEKRRQLGNRIIACEKEEDQQYERNRSTMSLKSIQTKFDCDAIDARVIADLLNQADDAGKDAAFGAPAKIENHPEFEDEAGLDLDTLETALLLDEGVLLQTFRDRYKKAYAARPATG